MAVDGCCLCFTALRCAALPCAALCCVICVVLCCVLTACAMLLCLLLLCCFCVFVQILCCAVAAVLCCGGRAVLCCAVPLCGTTVYLYCRYAAGRTDCLHVQTREHRLSRRSCQLTSWLDLHKRVSRFHRSSRTISTNQRHLLVPVPVFVSF